jgi:hypothetical protein
LGAQKKILLADLSSDSEVYVDMWKKSISTENYIVGTNLRNHTFFTFSNRENAAAAYNNDIGA